MMENHQKPNSSFPLILEALLPFYIDSKPEEAPRTKTFSCNLKVMTLDGKIKPHRFLTHFFQIVEVN